MSDHFCQFTAVPGRVNPFRQWEPCGRLATLRFRDLACCGEEYDLENDWLCAEHFDDLAGLSREHRGKSAAHVRQDYDEA